MGENGNKKVIALLGIAAVVVFFVVYVGIKVVNNVADEVNGRKIGGETVTNENKEALLEEYVKQVNATTSQARKASVELKGSSLAEELPDIDKYPLSVEGKADIVLEIFVSPEKAGEEKDRFLIDLANQFNSKMTKVGDKTVAISIRSMASGLGADYIISKKHVPDAYTPSNDLWGELINAQGGKVTMVEKRLAGNVAGILLTKEKQDELVNKYGAINMKTITQATAANEFAMGYTNPLSSSTGMNFLLSTLYAYDTKDVLSNGAKNGFTEFQKNVPYVAYTTMQMRESAKSGSLEGMVMEYQSYINDSDLKNNYTFNQFGYRHDNPMYSVGTLSQEKQKGLEAFVSYATSKEAQELATSLGFNQLDDYKSEMPGLDGNTILKAEKLWKENKDTGKDITAVFVADVSGSMDGEPLNQLKSSLINGAQYINNKNSIGLVSYSSKVTINLPIARFDLNQRAYFQGAVEDLSASGSTASFDAVIVAMDMLLEAKKDNPNTKPMMFLLSDGETNTGYSLDDIKDLLKLYEIPVYTIGYNADIDALQVVSNINEAASINADSDDVVYKLKSLFNAQM
ncbi:MAG: vWA domain-containing protein [bacterium]|nr:vWA domain-containing protein [bacterium]